MLLLELGVGGNTPVIIMYPFWRMAESSHKATYACVNLGESFCPREIVGQSVLLDAGITQVLRMWLASCSPTSCGGGAEDSPADVKPSACLGADSKS